MAGRWAAVRPSEVEGWLAGSAVDWWFAGGWAIDLWLGYESRDHSDIEIGCFRRDLPGLAPVLSGWDVCHARDKQLSPYDVASEPPEPPFSLWVRRPGSGAWSFEILPEERGSDVWCYRRDRRVTLPIAALTLRVPTGQRIVAPAVQLLYKAKQPRPKDAADFDAVALRLPTEARAWLRAALTVAHPGHSWIERL